jgi:hypothetical protein
MRFPSCYYILGFSYPKVCIRTVWNQDRYLGLEAILKRKG